jgi:hypothetical protein
MRYMLTILVILSLCGAMLMLNHSPGRSDEPRIVWVISQGAYIICVTESETFARAYADKHENITLSRRELYQP